MKNHRETLILIRKKKPRHGGHHGGAWKVAFADFMTSMMALFLVLWLVSQTSEVRAAVAGYFKDPLGRAHQSGNSFVPGEGITVANVRRVERLEVDPPRRDRLVRLGERIREQLAKAPQLTAVAQQVEIHLVSEGLRIELLEDSAGTFFENGRAVPRAAGVDLLTLLGVELGAAANDLVLEGHTDARPFSGGTSAGYSNWELSVDRANAARRILLGGGVQPTQIREVRGHADRELRYPEAPQTPGNRRVSILVVLDSAGAKPLLASPDPRVERGNR